MSTVALPRLKGRTFVVTGAGGGQGRAEALALAAAGARVIATDVTDAPSGTVPGVEYRRLEVSNDEGGAALAHHLADELGDEPLRGLVNNAGITHRARLGAVERDDWD